MRCYVPCNVAGVRAVSISWRRGPPLPIGLHGIYPIADEARNRIIVAGGAWKEGNTKAGTTWMLVEDSGQ